VTASDAASAPARPAREDSVVSERSRPYTPPVPVVLLIDDDEAVLDVLALVCEDAGFAVQTARDGREGLAAIRAQRPDLVVSDVNMPELDGFALCRSLREAGDGLPLILLTSRDNEIDEALGLDLGADDYVSKPFSSRVLLSRIKALLRRGDAVGVAVTESQVRRIGSLVLHAERLEAHYAQVTVRLTVSEYRLIDALTRRPGVVCTRAHLLEEVRGDDSVVAERIIDTYVRAIRRKIEAVEADFDRIETVIGAGYRWRDG